MGRAPGVWGPSEPDQGAGGGAVGCRHSPVTLESAPSRRITPATRDAAEAAATRAIEDFLAGSSEIPAPQSLSSENTKHPPAG
jgi:hypothetical protein